MTRTKHIPLIKRPWFAFLSSMRFAVALLSLLGVASIIGTVLQQNQPQVNYVVKFGPFWTEIFGYLGLFDVYASGWFVLIMLFLVISTGLCLWRNIPPFIREMKSYRLNAAKKSLAAMKHSTLLSGGLTPEIAERYLKVQGFNTKKAEREDGSTLIAAKKGAMNKWGYIFAHAAIIVICLGGLIDSNLLLKVGMLTGSIVPDNDSLYAKDFKPESTLGSNNISFRGNVNIAEGQKTNVVFLNADKGMLIQDLPFDVQLKRFHIDYYDTGMPKDFASDLIVTDSKTGKKTEHTIRVNHPLTVDGITIYQASFADGGSDLKLKAWNLAGNSRTPALMDAVSMQAFPLDIGEEEYKLEFDQFTAMNVQDTSMPSEDKPLQIQTAINDVRSVKQNKKFTNIGPSIVYRIRDKAGQAVEYKNYMLPIRQDDDYFYLTGTRTGLEQQYRWLRIPTDSNGSIDTFMAIRELINDPAVLKRIIGNAAQAAPANIRGTFAQGAEHTLNTFRNGGLVALGDDINARTPEADRETVWNFSSRIVYSTLNTVLDEAIRTYNLPEWQDPEARNRFLIHSMEAYTGLTAYPAPVLLQLSGYKEVRSSGLQMTRSPGASLVYLGSVLLVLGTIFMFYIREKRAWLLFDQTGIRFSMSSSRNERDLQKEFPKHTADLETLAKDLNH
ncbi:cytochrome c biogenesis protein ResB [Neisseria zalophi]|uniref:Cytochrome c biogenesis protein ResB n=1 Tax=Neisseria zalophi TaxID=640030 RepID=A0A5J6PVP4_9NEIS|nr:cytochrome c biogenesis protein ResB [Neisseria zalophi]QEY26799.1 cytochrome c biogenesis protein ResB [Neisseria zalophi]